MFVAGGRSAICLSDLLGRQEIGDGQTSQSSHLFYLSLFPGGVAFEGAYLLTQSIQTHIPYIHPTLMVPIYTDVQSIELNARAVSRKRVCFLPKMRQFPASAAK